MYLYNKMNKKTIGRRKKYFLFLFSKKRKYKNWRRNHSDYVKNNEKKQRKASKSPINRVRPHKKIEKFLVNFAYRVMRMCCGIVSVNKKDPVFSFFWGTYFWR